MPLLFDRRYTLDIVPPDGQARQVTGLRINFEAIKSRHSTPNMLRLEIYNAGPDTLGALQQKFTKITLNAGYGQNLGLMFSGELRNVYQQSRGVDSIISCFAGDGQSDWQNATVAKTFAPSIDLKTMVKDLISNFRETTVGSLEGLAAPADNIRGRTLSGSVKDNLDALANDYNFSWSIQDGEVITRPVDEPLSNSEAVLISAATGMVGSPTVTERGADVTTLLSAELLPGGLFRIESVGQDVALGDLRMRQSATVRTVATGDYIAEDVTHRGDTTEQGDWTTTATGSSYARTR